MHRVEFQGFGKQRANDIELSTGEVALEKYSIAAQVKES